MPTFLVPPVLPPPSRFARLRAWLGSLAVVRRVRATRVDEPRHTEAPIRDVRGRDDDLFGSVGGGGDPQQGEARLSRAWAWLGEAARAHRDVLAKGAFAVGAIALLLVAMGGTWGFAPATAIAAGPITSPTATATPDASPTTPTTPPTTPTAPTTPTTPTTGQATTPSPPTNRAGKAAALAGKLNLNTATAEQLVLLPTVGPSKAERVLVWRKKNGGFRRIADLRRVKGFGYKTFKKLEPFLAIDGDTTLARH